MFGESEHEGGFDIERHVDSDAVVIGTSVCAADEVGIHTDVFFKDSGEETLNSLKTEFYLFSRLISHALWPRCVGFIPASLSFRTYSF